MTEHRTEALKRHHFPIKIKTIRTKEHARSEVKIFLAGKEFASYYTTNPEDIRNTVKFIRTQVEKARTRQQELFDERFKKDSQIKAAYLLYKLKLLMT